MFICIDICGAFLWGPGETINGGNENSLEKDMAHLTNLSGSKLAYYDMMSRRSNQEERRKEWPSIFRKWALGIHKFCCLFYQYGRAGSNTVCLCYHRHTGTHAAWWASSRLHFGQSVIMALIFYCRQMKWLGSA